MGRFATTVQEYFCDFLSENYTNQVWETEYKISGTPVDLAGIGNNQLYLIELEWRRADPADNAAKLFRHFNTGNIDAKYVTVFHIFTKYYKTSRGDYSSKRKNAEFVGEMAAKTFNRLSYRSIEFPFDPPKRGEEWPVHWKEAADEALTSVCNEIEQ
ncbi:hypothetical protein [Natronocalculus amylovorans]|uniref:Restriction endonuclease n=1 Tax=Natronocalculus amylovorans TaxID=2917812 RepID=A0AAE3FYA7_9EURY|nr:hypothetical protein [Natronocalculus amylovorans]MCL9817787.1 hypothetical protein [Natronocalculus amylovorans]